MTRKVFFSFKYDDVHRAMNVRNSNVIYSDQKSGFIDKAAFEEVERKGHAAIKNWIDSQLSGTSVTVVLIGANTDKSKWVNYEIQQSISRGNGIITIDVSSIKDLQGYTTRCSNLRVQGYQHYHWINDNGRENIGLWVDKAAKSAGK